MGNKTAVVVAIFLAMLIGYDLVENDSEMTLFLARKGTELVEWLAFWR